MISDIDKEGSGQISFDSFVAMMTAKLSDRDSREDVARVFRLFDTEGRGVISVRELRRVAQELGEEISDAELSAMVELASSDGSGFVSAEDFAKIMMRKTVT